MHQRLPDQHDACQLCGTCSSLSPLPCSQDYTIWTDLDEYVSKADVKPVAFNVFCTLPLDVNSTNILTNALPQLAAMKALVLLTVEPTQGLHKVTYDTIGQLGYYIKQAQLVWSPPLTEVCLACHVSNECK